MTLRRRIYEAQLGKDREAVDELNEHLRQAIEEKMTEFVIPAMIWHSSKTGKERQVIDGYYTQGKRPNKARLWRYVAWKRHVQEHAPVELPLRPTKTLPLYIITIAYFQSGTHPDPENVHKSVVDALCYVGKEEQRLLRIKRGSDKYTGGLFASPRYDSESPRVGVWIMGELEFSHVRLIDLGVVRPG